MVPDYAQDNIKLFNADCMIIMKQYPDNYFDLAVVDPPYGIGRFSGRVAMSDRVLDAKINKWDKKPTAKYFNELFRISKNQIIWGANNFNLPCTEYFCIWDKMQTVDNFASAEYAFVSMGLKKPAKVFRYPICQEIQTRKKAGGKIHPTQKPVKLYNWIYANYAKPGQKIIDTHLGSGSNAIAAHYANMSEFVGCELDSDYFEASTKRLYNETRQLSLL